MSDLPKLPPARPSNPGHTHLYVVQSGEFIKIGHAANLLLRLSNMRVDNPHGPTLLWHEEIPRDMGRRLEKYCHHYLEDKWATGEWFRIPREEAMEAVAMMRSLLSGISRNAAA